MSHLVVVSQDIELAVDDVIDIVVQLPAEFDATTLGTDGSTDMRVAAYSAVSADALGSARQAVRETRQSARPGGRVEDFLDLSLDLATTSPAIERIGTDQLKLSVPTESASSTPDALQLPREGLYRWGAQKLAAWKLRLRFKTRPPTGYTVRVTYDYLAAESLAIVQGATGVTKLVFGTAPGNGKKLTAKYRTTPFHGLRVT